METQERQWWELETGDAPTFVVARVMSVVVIVFRNTTWHVFPRRHWLFFVFFYSYFSLFSLVLYMSQFNNRDLIELDKQSSLRSSSLSGAAKASCIWSSLSLQMGATCLGRTAPPSPPSLRSSTTTQHTSCQSEALNTCPYCILSLCRPSDTDTHILFLLVLLNTIYPQHSSVSVSTSSLPFYLHCSQSLDCLVPLFPFHHNPSNYTGSLRRELSASWICACELVLSLKSQCFKIRLLKVSNH